MSRLFAHPAALASFLLLGGELRGAIFQRHDTVRTCLTEPLLVQPLDELRQRKLPRLLVMIGEAAQLFRIHAELAGHLHMGVGQAESPARFDPRLEILRNLVLHLIRRRGP